MSYYFPKDDMPEILHETEKFVDIATYTSFYGKGKTREKKFLCVGGPFHGEYWSRTELRYSTLGCYREFNNASGSRHKVVFAWTEED